MEQNEIQVKSISDAYAVYKSIITDKSLCENNQEILSILAIYADAFSLASILDFFNKYPNYAKENWQSNLLIIRMFSLFATELMTFLSVKDCLDVSLIENPNSVEAVKSLRNKIHQFRNRDYRQKIQYIDQEMGRSRDNFKPHIDLCLQYTEGNILSGTNVYWFNFPEAKDYTTIGFMQQIIRGIEKISRYPKSEININPSNQKVTYKYTPYCYVDIVKNCKLKNKKLVDRLLLAFDDLCSVYDFFVYVVDVSQYLRKAPYITFYFTKMLAIILDETVDNLNNILKYNPTDTDAKTIERILNICPSNIKLLCKKIRNNIHYEKQEHILFDDELILFKELFAISNELIKEIRNVLNINPSKFRLNYYRFLKWVQE